ncbi:hypothetical protein, partial [Pseudomonas viridiflava]|uniref:hypothetical protein n=1 Tax=Pseudomonas viridiflava TaxID=33069 RepID=UPI0019D0C614
LSKAKTGEEQPDSRTSLFSTTHNRAQIDFVERLASAHPQLHHSQPTLVPTPPRQCQQDKTGTHSNHP